MKMYRKLVLGLISGIIILTLIYLFLIFNNHGIQTSKSESSGFPFYVLFPGWFILIIPIIAKKRRELQKLEEII